MLSGVTGTSADVDAQLVEDGETNSLETNDTTDEDEIAGVVGDCCMDGIPVIINLFKVTVKFCSVGARLLDCKVLVAIKDGAMEVVPVIAAVRVVAVESTVAKAFVVSSIDRVSLIVVVVAPVVAAVFSSEIFITWVVVACCSTVVFDTSATLVVVMILWSVGD